jgi:DMSO/TMAO reductase YedYZ molybdopterin-dependent catalytic subunit
MNKLTRRGFLAGLAASALAGCNVDPSARFWGFWSWAEGAWQGLLEAGPLRQARAKLYPRTAISKEFPIRSLELPDTYADMLARWELEVEGLIDAPRKFTLDQLKAAFPKVAEVTRHDCVEGWSAIAEWGGVRLPDFVAAMKPKPEAKYVVFHSADADEGGAKYYGSLTIAQAMHPQTLLAYEMNGQPLPLPHGAPLRLKVPTQLGYKSTKFIHKVSFVASLEGLAGGKGGYWEDTGYEHYAGI